MIVKVQLRNVVDLLVAAVVVVGVAFVDLVDEDFGVAGLEEEEEEEEVTVDERKVYSAHRENSKLD